MGSNGARFFVIWFLVFFSLFMCICFPKKCNIPFANTINVVDFNILKCKLPICESNVYQRNFFGNNIALMTPSSLLDDRFGLKITSFQHKINTIIKFRKSCWNKMWNQRNANIWNKLIKILPFFTIKCFSINFLNSGLICRCPISCSQKSDSMLLTFWSLSRVSCFWCFRLENSVRTTEEWILCS